MQSEVKKIEQLLGEDYLKKFRIFHEITLFPPCWEALKERRCPLCFNKLKIPKIGKIAYCRSAKHKKSFIIDLTKLNRI